MRNLLPILCGLLLLSYAPVTAPEAHAGGRLSDALRVQASRQQATVRWQDSEYNIELASMESIQALLNSFGDACKVINTSSGTLEGMRDLRVNSPSHYTATIINIDALLRRHSHSRAPRRGRASA